MSCTQLQLVAADIGKHRLVDSFRIAVGYGRFLLYIFQKRLGRAVKIVTVFYRGRAVDQKHKLKNKNPVSRKAQRESKTIDPVLREKIFSLAFLWLVSFLSLRLGVFTCPAYTSAFASAGYARGLLFSCFRTSLKFQVQLK
jgi:hypothetical protein